MISCYYQKGPAINWTLLHIIQRCSNGGNGKQDGANIYQEETQVPPVRVKLVKSIWLPPSHSAVLDVKLSANVSTDRPLLLEDCT